MKISEIDRRGFLKGAGAAGLSAAGLSAKDASAQVPGQKVAMEVGELDLDTKEYEPVNSGQAKAFVYIMSNTGNFVLQWVDPRSGKNIGLPEYFDPRGPGSDFKNRPNTMYFSDKNAVKVVPRGAPSGDLIYFTPRSWIAQKLGWKSVFYQLKT